MNFGLKNVGGGGDQDLGYKVEMQRQAYEKGVVGILGFKERIPFKG